MDKTFDRETYPKSLELDGLVAMAARRHQLGDHKYAGRVYKHALFHDGKRADAWLGLAKLSYIEKNFKDAMHQLDQAEKFGGETFKIQELRAFIMLDLKRLPEFTAFARKSLALYPDNYYLMLRLAKTLLRGPAYTATIKTMFEKRKPSTYLEIGLANGDIIRMGKGIKKAIGVDPAPTLSAPLHDNMILHELESDTYFAEKADAELIETPLDMAFVDGLHVADQTLRDILNCADYMQEHGKIFIHDVYPITEESQREIRETSFWTGDPWKAFLAIRQQVPEANASVMPCPPTGLGLIRNPGALKALTKDQRQKLFDAMVDMKFEDIMEKQDELLGLDPVDENNNIPLPSITG